MQHNVPSSADVDEPRPAPTNRLWKLADRVRAGADRVDDLAADAGPHRGERLLWKLADRLRSVAERVDDLAADVSPAGRWAW
ncbi:hypothetical protein OG411_14725 [Streptomyces pseudogriseolus]|uniref:hypothetical protein n=1 Tax=Streptomyces pseudogriseolus TaxID=36817 RepID=UPI0032457FB6